MDNAQTSPQQKPAKPRYKKKGPVRFEAIVPFSIIVVLVAAYFILFFDNHLKWGMEWGLSQLNGAEVNISKVKTSFVSASLEIRGIEATDPNEPKKNRFAVGNIQFKALWDALLRAKIVVDRAGITGIEVNTDRKSPGYVLPPAPEGGPSLAAKMKDKLVEAAFGDIAELLEGFDPSKGLQIVGELKSVAHVQQLNSDLIKKEAEWNTNLQKIPSEKDFAALQGKLNSISADGINNPAEAASRINAVKSVINESQDKVNAVTSLSGQLTGDISNFSSGIGKIDDMVAQDRSMLESKLKLPKLDAKSIAEQLFGPMIRQKVGGVERYVAMAKQYMPAKSAKKEAAPKPARGKGRLYEFPVTSGYPSFWIKRAEISSKGEFSAFAGDVSGEILNASSNQALINQPMLMNLQGDFPKQNVRGVLAKVTIDHRTESPVQSFLGTVEAYPVPDQIFSDSESFKFGIGKAVGKAKIDATLKDGGFSISSMNSFSNVDYQIAAKSKLLESTVRSIVTELPSFDVTARINGKSFEDFGLSIESNLAGALERGFARQLQAKLAEARKMLDDQIQARIMEPKRQLMAKFDATKAQLTSQIDARKKQAEGLKAQAEGKINQITQKASPQNKAVDAIKKKLPF